MGKSQVNVSKVAGVIVAGGGLVVYWADTRERRGYAAEINQCIADIRKEKDRIRAKLKPMEENPAG